MRPLRRGYEEEEARDRLPVGDRLGGREGVLQEDEGQDTGIGAEGDGRAEMRERQPTADRRPGDAGRRANALSEEPSNGGRGTGQGANDALEHAGQFGRADASPDAAGSKERFERACGTRTPPLRRQETDLRGQAALCRPRGDLCPVEQQTSALGHVWKPLMADPILDDGLLDAEGFR